VHLDTRGGRSTETVTMKREGAWTTTFVARSLIRSAASAAGPATHGAARDPARANAPAGACVEELGGPAWAGPEDAQTTARVVPGVRRWFRSLQTADSRVW
jgi:hypothetical protein